MPFVFIVNNNPMKLLSAFLPIILACPLLAQPVITMNELVPATGPAPPTYRVSDAPFGPAIGNFVFTVPEIVDMGILDPTPQTQQNMPASGTPYASAFPTATHASIAFPGAADHTYYEVDGNEVRRIGIKGDTTNMVFSTGEKLHQYPMAFDSGFFGYWDATYTSGSMGGQTNVFYDGHGTLILPFGTFSNVARITTTQIFEDYPNFDAVKWYSIGTVSYYTPGISSYLYRAVFVYWVYQDWPGGEQWYTASMIDPLSVGVLQAAQQQNDLMLYPNPTSSGTTLRLPSHFIGRLRVSVIDAAGRAVRDHELPAQETIRMELEGLASGIYRVRAIDGTGHSAQCALYVE
jgi:hypothetical protein